MSAGAATIALPLAPDPVALHADAPDPVALHADKLRAMVTDIRTNHPDKGARDALPWPRVAEWINGNPEVLGVQYSYSSGSIRQWHSGTNPSTTAMLSSISAYCIAHSKYQARELRADARNMKRDVAETGAQEAEEVEEADGDSFMSPAPKRRKGPASGSKQAATPVTWLTRARAAAVPRERRGARRRMPLSRRRRWRARSRKGSLWACAAA